MEEEGVHSFIHVAGTCVCVRCVRRRRTCVDLLAGGSRTLLDSGSRSRLPNSYRTQQESQLPPFTCTP